MAEPQIKLTLDLEDNLTENIEAIKSRFIATSDQIRRTTGEVLEFSKALAGTTALVGGITILAEAFTKLQEAAESPLGEAGIEFLTISAKKALTEIQPLTKLFSDLSKNSAVFFDGFANGIRPQSASIFRKNSEQLVRETIGLISGRIAKANIGGKIVDGLTFGIETGLKKSLPIIESNLKKINEATEKNILPNLQSGAEVIKRKITGRATSKLTQKVSDLDDAAASQQNLTKKTLLNSVKGALVSVKDQIKPILADTTNFLVEFGINNAFNNIAAKSLQSFGNTKVDAIADFLDNVRLKVAEVSKIITRKSFASITENNDETPNFVRLLLGDDIKLTKTKIALSKILSTEGSAIYNVLQTSLEGASKSVISTVISSITGTIVSSIGDSIGQSVLANLGAGLLEPALKELQKNSAGIKIDFIDNIFADLNSSIASSLQKPVQNIILNSLEFIANKEINKFINNLVGDLRAGIINNFGGIIEFLDSVSDDQISAFLDVSGRRINKFIDNTLQQVVDAGISLSETLSPDQFINDDGFLEANRIISRFVDGFIDTVSELDSSTRGLLTNFLDELRDEAIGGVLSEINNIIAESFSGLINTVDEFITQFTLKISALSSEIQGILDPIANTALYLTGAGEPLELLQDLSNASVQFAQSIFSVTQQLTYLRAGIDALRSFIANSPFQGLIDQNAQLRESILATRASLAATSSIKIDGVQSQGALESIKLLQEPVSKAIKDLRKGSLELVGVTSDELVPIFQIVAQNAVEVGASLKDAKDLTLAFSASLGTLGIPLSQARQEINSILQGQITINSALAKTLNLTNAQINSYKMQGTLVQRLQERLSAFTQGNALAARELAGVTSNIAELFQEINRVAGESIFDDILDKVNDFYTYLVQNRETLTTTFSSVIQTIFNGLGKLVTGLVSLKDTFFNIFGNLPQFLASSFESILSAISNGLEVAATVLEPLSRVFASLVPFINTVGGGLFQLGVTLKVLTGGIEIVSKAFNTLAKLLPITGELLFFVDLRTSGLIAQFLNLSSAIGRGGASFLLLAKNLERVPFLQGLVADSMTKLLGGIPLLGNAVTSILPQFGSLGITLVGLAKSFPAFGQVLQNVLKILPGAVRSFGTLVSVTPLISPLGTVIKDVANQLDFFAQKGDLAEFVTRQFDNQLRLAGMAFQKFVAQTLLTGGAIGFLVIFFDELILKNEQLKTIFEFIVTKIREFANGIMAFFSTPASIPLLILLLEITGLLPRILQITNEVANQIGELGSNAIISAIKRLIGFVTGIGEAFTGVAKAIIPAKKGITDVFTISSSGTAREIQKLTEQRNLLQDERQKIKQELDGLAQKFETVGLTPEEGERGIELNKALDKKNRALNEINEQLNRKTGQNILDNKIEAEAKLNAGQQRVQELDQRIAESKKEVEVARQTLESVKNQQINLQSESEAIAKKIQADVTQLDNEMAQLTAKRESILRKSSKLPAGSADATKLEKEALDIEDQIIQLQAQRRALEDKQFAQRSIVEQRTQSLDLALGLPDSQKSADELIKETTDDLLQTKKAEINRKLEVLQKDSDNITETIIANINEQSNVLQQFGIDLQKEKGFTKASLSKQLEIIDAELFNAIKEREEKIIELKGSLSNAIKIGDSTKKDNILQEIERTEQEIKTLRTAQTSNVEARRKAKEEPKQKKIIEENKKQLQEQLASITLSPEDIQNAINEVDAQIAKESNPQLLEKLDEKKRNLLLVQADSEAKQTFKQRQTEQVKSAEQNLTQANKGLARAEIERAFELKGIDQARNDIEKAEKQLLLKRLEVQRSNVALAQEELASISLEIERLNKRIQNGQATKDDLIALNELNRKRSILQDKELLAQREAIATEQEITGGIIEKVTKSKAIAELEQRRNAAQQRISDLQAQVSNATTDDQKEQFVKEIASQQQILDKLTKEINRLTLDEQLVLAQEQKGKAENLKAENDLIKEEIRSKQNRIANIKNTPSLEKDAGAQAELTKLEEEVEAQKKQVQTNEEQIAILEQTSERNRIGTLQVKRSELLKRIAELQKQLLLLKETPDSVGKTETIAETEKQITELMQQENELKKQVEDTDKPFNKRVEEAFNEAEARRKETLTAQQDALEQTFNLDLDSVSLLSANDIERDKRKKKRRRKNKNKGIFGRLRILGGDIADAARGLVGLNPEMTGQPATSIADLQQQVEADAQQVKRRRQKQLADRAKRGRNVIREFIGDRIAQLDSFRQKLRASRVAGIAAEAASIEAAEANLDNITDPKEKEKAQKDIARRKRINEIRRNRGIRVNPLVRASELATDSLTAAAQITKQSLDAISRNFQEFVANPVKKLKDGLGQLGQAFIGTFKGAGKFISSFMITLNQALFLANAGIRGFAVVVKKSLISIVGTFGDIAKSLIASFAPILAFTAAFAVATELYSAVTKANDLYNKSVEQTNETLREQAKQLALNSRLRKEFLKERTLILQAELDALQNKGEGTSERANKLRERIRKLQASEKNTEIGLSDKEREQRIKEAQDEKPWLRGVGAVLTIPETLMAVTSLDPSKVGNTYRRVVESNVADREMEVARLIEGINLTLLEAEKQKALLQEKVKKVAELRNELSSTINDARRTAIEQQIKAEEDTISAIQNTFKFDELLQEAFAKVINKDQEEVLINLQALAKKKKEELEEITNAVLSDIELVVAGSDVTQLKVQAEQAIKDIDTSFLEGFGNIEKLNQRIEFFTKSVTNLVELRQLTEEEAVRTLERIAANPFIETQKAEAGLEALNQLSKRFLERRTEDLQFIKQQNEKLIAEGRVNILDFLPKFTQQDLEIADQPLIEFTKRRNNVLKNLDEALKKEIEFRRKRLNRDLAAIDIQLSRNDLPQVSRNDLTKQRKALQDEFDKAVSDATQASSNKRLELLRTFSLEEVQIQEKRLQERAAIFQKEIQQTEEQIKRINQLERNSLTERNELRLLALRQQTLQGTATAEELANAEAEIEAETTRNSVDVARKQLEALQEIQSRAVELAAEDQQKIQQQVADARIALIKAVSDAIAAEDRLLGAFVAKAESKLKIFEKQTSNTIEAENLLLQEQKQIADQLNESLSRRKKLLEEAKSVFDSQQRLTDKELEIIQSDSGLNELEKQEIAQQTASIKIESALLEIELQKESLRIEQEQQRIALARRDIENEIAEKKAEIEVLTKQNQLTLAQAKLQVEPQNVEYQLAVAEAELALRSALLQREAISQEREFINQDKALLEQQFAIQNQNQANQERVARLSAAQEIVKAAETAKDPLAGQLRQQVLDDIAVKGGLTASKLLNANQSQIALNRILDNTSFTGAIDAIDPRLRNAATAFRNVLSPPKPISTDQGTQPTVTIEKLTDGSIKETIELVDAITETIKDAKGKILSITSKAKQVDRRTESEKIIGDRLTQEREAISIATPNAINEEIKAKVQELKKAKENAPELDINTLLPKLNPPNETLGALRDREQAEIERKAQNREQLTQVATQQLEKAREQLQRLGSIEDILTMIAEKITNLRQDATSSKLSDQNSAGFFDQLQTRISQPQSSLVTPDFFAKSKAFFDEQRNGLAFFAPSSAISFLTQAQALISGNRAINRNPETTTPVNQINQGTGVSARNAPISQPFDGSTKTGNTFNVNNNFNINVGNASDRNNGQNIAEQVSEQVNEIFTKALSLATSRR